ncbi:hypothetical protein RHS01_05402 [Rhizoctonia solani]|uniref:Uncharacterized protein n=1 Tax=Rhizoctonia solani TaxID=456999 RepID=A0A8H7IGP0_9AGAM|nr:hypothetical protein RHS01_05402 [Rhizoctonia solani]
MNRNLTAMIGDGEFVATDKNLEALKTGNSASLYAVRLIQDSDPDAKKAMESITTLLKSNADSSYQQLHPAAVRSLAHGAALLEACSDEPLLSRSDVEHYIITYQAYMREDRDDKPPITGISDAGVSASASVYLRQASGLSTDKGQQDFSGLLQLYWIWCAEVTANPAQCGLDPSSTELTSLKTWSSRYLSESDPVNTQETPTFLAAINRRLQGQQQPLTSAFLCDSAMDPNSPRTRLHHRASRTLKRLLESQSRLEIESKGMNRVKEDLESEIIKYYRANRLDTYSARVIECIRQARDTRPHGKMASLIEQKLKDVPPCHRGLKQFSHSPEATSTRVDLELTVPLPVSRSALRPPSRKAGKIAGRRRAV